MRKLLLTVLLLGPMLCAAQIYKTTDEQGNVSYSDTPPTSGTSEEIKLRQTNTAPPPPESLEPAPVPADADAVPDTAAASYKVSISSPANETTFPMGPGNFSVSAAVTPPPRQGALLQLYVDGVASGGPQTGSSWSLTNVFRGAHDVHVAVVDATGKELAKSSPVRVYVLRPSTNRKK